MEFPWKDPTTFAPCCCNSGLTSRLIIGCPPGLTADPAQQPVTVSVTKVRSIQSIFAQPELKTTVAAMSSWAVNFIHVRRGLCVGQECLPVQRSGGTGRAAIWWVDSLSPPFRAGASLADLKDGWIACGLGPPAKRDLMPGCPHPPPPRLPGVEPTRRLGPGRQAPYRPMRSHWSRISLLAPCASSIAALASAGFICSLTGPRASPVPPAQRSGLKY